VSELEVELFAPPRSRLLLSFPFRDATAATSRPCFRAKGVIFDLFLGFLVGNSLFTAYPGQEMADLVVAAALSA
jgi:hypothetical protein